MDYLNSLGKTQDEMERLYPSGRKTRKNASGLTEITFDYSFRMARCGAVDGTAVYSPPLYQGDIPAEVVIKTCSQLLTPDEFYTLEARALLHGQEEYAKRRPKSVAGGNQTKQDNRKSVSTHRNRAQG